MKEIKKYLKIIDSEVHDLLISLIKNISTDLVDETYFMLLENNMESLFLFELKNINI